VSSLRSSTGKGLSELDEVRHSMDQYGAAHGGRQQLEAAARELDSLRRSNGCGIFVCLAAKKRPSGIGEWRSALAARPPRWRSGRRSQGGMGLPRLPACCRGACGAPGGGVRQLAMVPTQKPRSLTPTRRRGWKGGVLGV